VYRGVVVRDYNYNITMMMIIIIIIIIIIIGRTMFEWNGH